jgi:hypothetical protein
MTKPFGKIGVRKALAARLAGVLREMTGEDVRNESRPEWKEEYCVVDSETETEAGQMKSIWVHVKPDEIKVDFVFPRPVEMPVIGFSDRPAECRTVCKRVYSFYLGFPAPHREKKSADRANAAVAEAWLVDMLYQFILRPGIKRSDYPRPYSPWDSIPGSGN